jgi:hypothetical protein
MSAMNFTQTSSPRLRSGDGRFQKPNGKLHVADDDCGGAGPLPSQGAKERC